MITNFHSQDEDDLVIAPGNTADGLGFQFGEPKLPQGGFHF